MGGARITSCNTPNIRCTTVTALVKLLVYVELFGMVAGIIFAV